MAAGPYSLIFACLVLINKIPYSEQFSLFGIPFTDKTILFALCLHVLFISFLIFILNMKFNIIIKIKLLIKIIIIIIIIVMIIIILLFIYYFLNLLIYLK